jgi:hypothetical protein
MYIISLFYIVHVQTRYPKHPLFTNNFLYIYIIATIQVLKSRGNITSRED